MSLARLSACAPGQNNSLRAKHRGFVVTVEEHGMGRRLRRRDGWVVDAHKWFKGPLPNIDGVDSNSDSDTSQGNKEVESM